MEKLKNQFTINTTDETANEIKTLANAQRRKPAELLRLILEDTIHDLFIKLQIETHKDESEIKKASFKA